MGQYDEEARARLRRWVVARRVTRTTLGEAAGHNQSWASRYLDEEFLAGLDRRSFLTTLALLPGLAWLNPAPQSGIMPTEFLGTLDGFDTYYIRHNPEAQRIALKRLCMYFEAHPRPYTVQFIEPSRETETP